MKPFNVMAGQSGPAEGWPCCKLDPAIHVFREVRRSVRYGEEPNGLIYSR
jgi:hypothetical protein